ncbi:hypothetical protein R2F61_09710 (plasmid) [Mollicutes bacterium LVI A0078]|nr:hypothetical protein RZE84_09475 [Mollicutes bacterium LVI A0075]WOO90040.1 hypothetical protein RZE84_09435 [Mollicutes bacterium LVI A0075]WOO91919.1 hypothetical protein R2F61_09820 [Mollicutes bacterium LVI A0078]WOO91936.1 hypothetical protein R2F61_09710 [Mollicutes bacterium LVI A0078]
MAILTLSGCGTGSGAFTEASDFLEQNNYNLMSADEDSDSKSYRSDGDNIRVLLQSDENDKYVDTIFVASMAPEEGYDILYRANEEQGLELKEYSHGYYENDDYTSDEYTDTESCELVETKMLEEAMVEEIDVWNNTKDYFL